MNQSTPSTTAIVARNTMYQFIGKAITMALSMVSLAMVAGSLPKAQFGEFSIIFSIIFITAVSLTEIKVEQVAVRDIAEDEQRYNLLINQSTILKMLVSLMVVVGVSIWIWLGDYSAIVKTTAYISLIGVFFSAAQSGFYSAIQYNLKAYLLTAAEVIAKVVTTVLTIILVWLFTTGQLHVTATTSALALVATILPAVIILICFVYWATKYMKVRIDLRPNRATLIELARDSWPLWVMGILIVIHTQIGYIMLSHFKSEEDVAVFALSRRFMEVIITLPPLFLASVYPLLSRYAATEPARLSQAIQKSFNFLVMTAAIICVITFYGAPQIISIFGNSQYPQSIAVLQVLTVAIFSSFIYGLFQSYLVATRQQRLVVYTLVAAIAINIFLNLGLLGNLSYFAPAIAAAVTETIILVSLLIIIWYRFSMKLNLSTAAKSMGLAAVVLVLLGLSNLNQLATDTSLVSNFLDLSLIAALALIIYGILIYWAKILPSDIIEHSLSLLPLPQKLKDKI